MSEPVADLAGARNLSNLKVALVHEWFDTYAGSERVVEQIMQCFPQVDLLAVVDFMAESERGFFGGRKVRTSFIQRLPFARRKFRAYLGLMPYAVEQLDVTGYDLVISSSHAVAKGVITGPDQVHISYVHSPMRYAWDLQHQYLRQANLTRGLKSIYVRWLLSRLRQWDVRAATSVDIFIANSSYVARRIRKAYRRESQVIHPPVDVDRFKFQAEKAGYYFVVSRQVPYKRIDLIAAAFAQMPDRQLIIVGDGPEHERVAEAAKGAANITLRGPVSHDELLPLMQSARALLVAAEEDFGITTVEAQACGTPVISYGRGGALDIIVTSGRSPPTGVLFDEQTPAAIIAAVERFERMSPAISPAACRANAMRFSAEVFRRRLLGCVTDAMLGWNMAAEGQRLAEVRYDVADTTLDPLLMDAVGRGADVELAGVFNIGVAVEGD